MVQSILAMTSSKIRILIADDHPLLREGVVAVVGQQADMEVVGEAATGPEAV
jgi:DNA-binding NarL/FixJ family response regulator